MKTEYTIGIGFAIIMLIAIIVYWKSNEFGEKCSKAKCSEGTHAIVVTSQSHNVCICATYADVE